MSQIRVKSTHLFLEPYLSISIGDEIHVAWYSCLSVSQIRRNWVVADHGTFYWKSSLVNVSTILVSQILFLDPLCLLTQGSGLGLAAGSNLILSNFVMHSLLLLQNIKKCSKFLSNILGVNVVFYPLTKNVMDILRGKREKRPYLNSLLVSSSQNDDIFSSSFPYLLFLSETLLFAVSGGFLLFSYIFLMKISFFKIIISIFIFKLISKFHILPLRII